jgi:hypothetical protein
MKYDFLEFDELMAMKEYDDSTGQGCYSQCLYLMRAQHSKDAAIMKQLIEIIEKMEKALEGVPRYDLSESPPRETFAFVRAREALAELNKWRNE